jgi:ABC-type transport system substrate-binding protein
MFATRPAISAVPPGQRGPRIDTVRWKVTRSPAAQLVEMTLGPPDGSDGWFGMIRPTDVEEMDRQGKTVSSRPGFHFCEFGFNYRKPPLDDVNFRHALAHLVPKKRIIATLFKFIVVKVDTPVPPAQGKWHNPYVDPHPYSPETAEAILAAAGYQKVGGVWKMPDGSDIPTLRVYIPLEIVAPTSFSIGRMFVEEAHAIGLTSLSLEPMDFSTYVDLVFDEWDFEIFWVCWGLGRVPLHLYSFFHSINNFKGSYNPYGINYPELDQQLDILYTSLDPAAQLQAAWKAQELVMGGSTTDPLAIPAQPERSQAIPLLTVYSRNMYDTMDHRLRGAINMFGAGIDNGWTWMSIHWSGDEPRPGTKKQIVVPILDEFPEKLNPTFAGTVYAWTMMDPTFDGLIAMNPWTQRDIPWLATDWSYQEETTQWGTPGMWIKFNLRTTDFQGESIKWQDGTPISPTDVKFAWEFLHDKQIPRYWDDMRYLLTVDIVGNEITAHMNVTSPWIVYALAGLALMFPPQVWQPWYAKTTDEILAWDPSAEPFGDLPTSVFGTGPFILRHSTLFIETHGYGDLKANRGYWLRTTQILDLLATMFHAAGDVDRNGEIKIPGDLKAIGAAFGTTPGDDRWNPDADIAGWTGVYYTGLGKWPPPSDGEIDIDDLATAGKFYGETKYVPPKEE